MSRYCVKFTVELLFFTRNRFSAATDLWIVQFHSNLVQTLVMWHLMFHKCSRSICHRSRSQHDI